MAQAYTSPDWSSGEGISASNLQSISNVLEGIVQGSDRAIHHIEINGSNLVITYVDGTTETFGISEMKGISEVTKASSGNVDTYTMIFTDGTTYSFSITNGKDGKDGADGKDGINTEEAEEVINARTSADGTTYTNLKTRIDTEVSELNEDLTQIRNEKEFDLPNTGHHLFSYNFRVGNTYRLINTSNAGHCTAQTRAEDKTTILEWITQGTASQGRYADFTPTIDSNYVNIFTNTENMTVVIMNMSAYTIVTDERLDSIEKQLAPIVENKYTFEDNAGAHYFNVILKKGHRYIVRNLSKSATAMNIWAEEKVEEIATPLNAQNYVYYTPNADYSFIRTFFNNANGVLEIEDTTTLDYHVKELELPYKVPLVNFEFNHELKDMASEESKIDYVNGKYTILEQVYALFDGLISAHSDYISKVDALTLTDLSYPTYANGVTTEGTYKVTPRYRTFMYKLISNNPYVNTSYNTKKKLLIVGGTHGNETFAPFNLYEIAKNLCECIDSEWFKFRSAFDVYIIPCLNGYGMYHKLRGNGNLVNINRNYPVARWAKNGENTKSDIEDYINQFTGNSAGSEFETKLIMQITNVIKPDIAIDHHNYSASSEWQFYAELSNDKLMHVAHESLVDCSYSFKKKYPSYFGSGFYLLQNASGSAPGYPASSTNGTTERWWFEHGVPICATVEVSEHINYQNGVYNSNGADHYGKDAMSVAEYTLKNMMMRLCQIALEME